MDCHYYLVEISTKLLRSVIGVLWERHWSVYGAWSGQGRDNLGTTLGQRRDNPYVVFIKNGSFGEFRVRISRYSDLCWLLIFCYIRWYKDKFF
jgi:hypothetical protein